jgi:hypothetical protein
VAAGFPVTEINRRRMPRGANERVTTSVRRRDLPGDALVELEVEQLSLYRRQETVEPLYC